MVSNDENYEQNNVDGNAINQLFLALIPLTIGLTISGVLGFFSHELAIALFGEPPQGTQGYLVLAIVLLPFIATAAYTEFSLTKAETKALKR